MKDHQSWLEAPYQIDQEKKSGMIAIPSGLGFDYISNEEAEETIALNEKRIDYLERKISGEDGGEDVNILRELQELEDENEMLRSALKGEFDSEFGETLESTLDPNSPEYDPDFARIYEKQQKGLKEVDDSLDNNKDEDSLETEESGEPDPIDLSKGKIVTLPKQKFDERQPIPEHLLWKPSQKYSPLKEGFVDVIDPKTGKNWTKEDIGIMLSDIKEYVDKIEALMGTPEGDQKAKKLSILARNYMEKANFPSYVATKRFPVLNEAYYGFGEMDYAEDTMQIASRQKKINYFLDQIESKLKSKHLPEEKKSDLLAKKVELEAMKRKMQQFSEEYIHRDWFDRPATTQEIDDYIHDQRWRKNAEEYSARMREKYLEEEANKSQEEIDEEIRKEEEEERKENIRNQKELEYKRDELEKKKKLSFPKIKTEPQANPPEIQKDVASYPSQKKEKDPLLNYDDWGWFADRVAIPKRIMDNVKKNKELGEEISFNIRELKRALKSSQNPTTIKNAIKDLISEGYNPAQIAFEIPLLKDFTKEVDFSESIQGKIVRPRILKKKGQFDSPEIKQKFKDVESQLKRWKQADNVQYFFLNLLNKYGFTVPELLKIAPDLKKHLQIRGYSL